MQILVTGGAGYIGSSVVKLLLDSGMSVVVYDDLSEGDKEKIDARARFIQGDVCDVDTLESVFKTYEFTAVVHCAAKKVMFESEADPTKYFKNNVGGTINVLSLMETYGVPKIIFSSTAAVYAPTTDGHPVVEHALTDPQSVYGRSKLMCEMLIAEYARLGKVKSYIIFRYFNVAGDSGLLFKERNPQGVFPLLARAIATKSPFQVFGTSYDTRDGSAVRDYIHVHDLAQAHRLALEEGVQSGIYNLGTSTGYTVYELVAAFKDATGKEFEVVKSSERQGDVPVMLANATKARELLGWTPTKTLAEMVKSTALVFEL
jgi:UDP-glucose 4-epimerase